MKSTRKRLAEWSKTPEGRESYEKVAEEMRKQIKDGEELEKEIQDKRSKLIEVFGPMNGEQVLAIKDFARHFAQWGAEHLKK